MRPKLHQLRSGLICRSDTSFWNPRNSQCFTEEDYIGHFMMMVKGSVHSSSLGKRALQRWVLLRFNSYHAASWTPKIELIAVYS